MLTQHGSSMQICLFLYRFVTMKKLLCDRGPCICKCSTIPQTLQLSLSAQVCPQGSPATDQHLISPGALPCASTARVMWSTCVTGHQHGVWSLNPDVRVILRGLSFQASLPAGQAQMLQQVCTCYLAPQLPSVGRHLRWPSLDIRAICIWPVC